MGTIAFLVFILLFVFFLFGLFSIAEGRPRLSARANRRGRQRPSPRARNTARHQGGRSSTAARFAMQRAGYDGGESYVNVTDVGLLAYRQTDEPKLVRNGDVLLDTGYLRPFAELWLPHQARGTVRFELVDHEGRLRYADEERYDLARGRNTLLPSTWLPLHDKTIHPADWELRVLAGEMLLAAHAFGWQEVGGGMIQPYIEADGEISPELQQALRARSREAVSLSDLLADQEDWT